MKNKTEKLAETSHSIKADVTGSAGLTQKQIKELMTKHIFALSEDELKAIAFLLDIEISHFNKSEWQISFNMTHKLATVIVECGKNSNCSIGRTRKTKNGISGLTSWGGCFSFASAIRIFRGFFSGGYELTIQSPEKLKHYSKDQWQKCVLLANDYVEKAA